MASLPSWPNSSLPQHHAVPAVVSAHVCWSPAVTALNVVPAGRPVVSTGLGEGSNALVPPLPSLPLTSLPQQYTVPALVSPQLWKRLPVSAVKVASPSGAMSTGLGEGWSSSVPPFPNWKLPSLPQHHAMPAPVSPQACSTPAATCTNDAVLGTLGSCAGVVWAVAGSAGSSSAAANSNAMVVPRIASPLPPEGPPRPPQALAAYRSPAAC